MSNVKTVDQLSWYWKRQVDCIGWTAAPHFACYFNDPLLENFIVSENKSL